MTAESAEQSSLSALQVLSLFEPDPVQTYKLNETESYGGRAGSPARVIARTASIEQEFVTPKVT